MLDHQTCKNILNEGDIKYTDEEVKKISELVFFFAQLTVQTYYELLEKEGN
ncbi:MAG TPA: hypothetical protein VMR70_18020 [Flavisolibacter sp.]|nr:hypothetical protein [Flavisolibacter sp.]